MDMRTVLDTEEEDIRVVAGVDMVAAYNRSTIRQICAFMR